MSNGWYFPAINELGALYAGFCGLSVYPGYEADASMYYREARDRFNATLSGNGGTPISEHFSLYWSSTEYDSDWAWHQNFGAGGQYYSYSYDFNTYKQDTRRVRAIRAF
jgi:hypothetical protein